MFYRRYAEFLRGDRVIRYYNIPDHDIHEALSEEDLYVAQALKSPPRRSSAGYYQNWVPQRSSADRYDTTTSPAQLSRRVRTRPEPKPFMEVEFVDRRKCSRCGSVSIRKPSSPRRNSYRFQDSSSFPTKGCFGKRTSRQWAEFTRIRCNCAYAIGENCLLFPLLNQPPHV